ncbi:MAG: hypothetical protein PHF51_04225 [Candidatus ainarchaeum sp.]|nr:hypothetical protein [Candidatus ainarchaeum sp.]
MAKASVIDIIQGAYELYAEKWREAVSPFIALFAVAILFGAISFIASVSGNAVCSATRDSAAAALCAIPRVFEFGVSALEKFVSLFVIMAALAPLYGLVRGKKMGNWFAELGPQFVNTLKVILLRAALTVAAFLPFLAVVLLNIAALAALLAAFRGGNAAPFALGGFTIVLIAAALLTGILVALVQFFLTFLEIEVVLGKKGVMDALAASVSLVRENLLDVFLFNVVWWLIGIAVGMVTLLLCCTIILIPLTIVIVPLIVTPIEWLSRIMLWQALSGAGAKKGR